MVYEVLIVVAVGILWAAVGVIFSRVARRGEDFLSFIAFSSFLVTVCAWLLIPRYHILLAQPAVSHLRSLPIMLSAGLLAAVGITAMNYGMRRGHHGATWTMGQSAFVIPFVLGVVVWGDKIKMVNIGGILAILSGIVLLGRAGNNGGDPEKRTAKNTWLFVVLMSLFFMGAQQTLVTLPSRWSDWQDAARLRVPLLVTGSMIGYNALRIGLRRPFKVRAWGEAVMLCAVVILSQLLLFLSLDVFAASSRSALVFPVAVGTCTTAFALYSLLLLKEKATSCLVLGMGLGCIGVILVSLK